MREVIVWNDRPKADDMKKAESGQGTPPQGGSPPAILYVDCRPEVGMERRRLAGMRRYAAGRGWRVETLEHGDCSLAALREVLDRVRPIGCVAECWCPQTALPPVAFGDVPVVHFEPPDGPAWCGASGVTCDNGAVARLAFQELSDGNPPAYAVVSNTVDRRWARERIDAFRACCRGAGFDSPLAVFPEADVPRDTPPAKSLVSWAASLPPHCAVFAVNDLCAHNVAKALVAAGRPFPRTVTLVGADGVEPPPTADRTIPAMVSSVVLDHEMAGYLAAKAFAFAANDGLRCAQNEGSRKREMEGASQMEGRASREMEGAAFAVNSFGGKAATLHCGEAAPSFSPQANPSLPPQAAAPSLQRWEDGTAVFPPLLVDRRQSTRGRGRREPRILEAMEMIRREACDGLTAAALAARFPGTRRLFDLRFREAIGHPPLDEILNIRLERAMELLVHAESPISVISSMCGFPSEWEFWHFFRKRTGVPPLRFRRERR